MAAFTTVTDGFELSPAHFAEIVDAVNERRAAAVASGATGLPAAITATGGTVIQIQGNATTKPVHLLIQEMLEALAAADVYVDHGAAVPVGTLYDLASWRSRAGLDSYGFRRATAFTGAAAPTYSYGLIQTGDIAGYWIWEDIVAGLSALKWTRLSTSSTAYQSRSGEATHSSKATAATNADTAWAGAAWSTGGIFNRYGAITVSLSGSDYTVRNFAGRSKQKATFATDAPVAGVADFYHRPIARTDITYFDFEGLAEDAWERFEVATAFAAEAASVTSTLTTIEAPTATPATDAIAAGALPADNDECGFSWTGTRYAVLKWDFSRA